MARHVIVLQGEPNYTEDWAAVAALTPGHLLELASATTCQKHSGAAGQHARLVALERDEMGNDIDDAYAASDAVKVAQCAPGDRAYMYLASGENVAAGAMLESAGNGMLQAVSGTYPVGMALEAVNAASGDARIRVLIV